MADIVNSSWYKGKVHTITSEYPIIQQRPASSRIGVSFTKETTINFSMPSKALPPLPSVPESGFMDTAKIINTYTIAILGQSWVGKSTLATRVSALDKSIGTPERDNIYQFCQQYFESEYYPTIQDDLSISAYLDNALCRIDISDTPGEDEYDILVQESIGKADGFIVAYSMLDLDSFIRAQALYHRITRQEGHQYSSNAIVTVATKSDEAGQRTVTESYGRWFARHNECAYLECSAKTGENVNAVFTTLVKALRAKPAKGENKESIRP